MVLSASDRVGLIRFLRDQLGALPFADADLLTHEFGLGGLDRDAWKLEDTVEYLTRHLRTGNDGDLTALATHLGHSLADSADRTSPTPSSMEAVRPLTLFASHLSLHKVFVGQVAGELEKWGVTLFVAHTDIEPDNEWSDVILASLASCDGGIAFLQQGFKESDWCDQEVGWLLGRGVPVFSIKFEIAPYGPLGRRQAIAGIGRSAEVLAAEILDRIENRPELRSGLTASLVDALAESQSFRSTDRVWSRLMTRHDLTREQCSQLIGALDTNTQVRWPDDPYSQRPYFESLPAFLRGQPAFDASLETSLAEVILRHDV